MTGDVARATAWLDRLEGLHTAASPGEWRELTFGGRDHAIGQEWTEYAVVCGRQAEFTVGDDEAAAADAAAIVAEHNAMPALLALARGVTALAEELREWRNNAERFAATVVDGPDYERALGRVRAYERAIERLTRLLADAAPHTGQETP